MYYQVKQTTERKNNTNPKLYKYNSTGTAQYLKCADHEVLKHKLEIKTCCKII